MSNATQTDTALTTGPKTLKQLLADVNSKKRFEELLGKRASSFISSVISVHAASKQLQKVSPESILAAAAKAASFNLPIDPNLGQAAIVPYGEEAQFQVMAKGIIQMAHRTGKYKKVILEEVFEGQLVKYDRFKNEIVLDESLKKSDLVEGFYFAFELINGYKHEAYWSVRECIDHGWKFSKSFKLYGSGQWMEDPLIPTKGSGRDKRADLSAFKGLLTHKSGAYGMCAKTVVKNEITKWGPLSIEDLGGIADVIKFDQAVVRPDGTPDYIDATTVKDGDAETDVAPEMPKPAQLPETNLSKEAQTIDLAGGTYTVVKAGAIGARLTARDGKVYATSNEDVSKFLFKVMPTNVGLRLTFWQGANENELEAAETIKG